MFSMRRNKYNKCSLSRLLFGICILGYTVLTRTRDPRVACTQTCGIGGLWRSHNPPIPHKKDLRLTCGPMSARVSKKMNSKVAYRQQFTRCGKQRCRKCREGEGHGPYWYAYWSENGHTVSKYIGAHLPPGIAQQSSEEGNATQNEAIYNTPTPILRVYLLGQFRVERKSGSEWYAIDQSMWQHRRARALLGCLLSSTGRRLGRERVIELLWPDLDRDIAANRLNGAVHELRRILEPDIARPAATRMLRLERDMLELADSSQIWVDAEAFEHLLKEADAATDTELAERLLEEAASLYRGDYLLEELYSEWAAPRRDALQQKWIGLLLNLANLRAERGDLVDAIEALDRLRAADPMNETAL